MTTPSFAGAHELAPQIHTLRLSRADHQLTKISAAGCGESEESGGEVVCEEDQGPRWEMIDTPGETCGESLGDPVVFDGVDWDNVANLVLEAGFIPGQDCRYVQHVEGLLYM
jgi:hypothetical protein